jgi:hypothetical protein
VKKPNFSSFKVSRRFVAWVGIAVVVGAGAFFAGKQLRPTEPADFVFDYGAAAYDVPASAAGLSLGGFSGFGAIADQNGYVVVSGKAIEVTTASLVLEAPWGTRTTVRLSTPPTVQRLDAATASDFKAGDKVLVRVAPDGETAEGILKLP